MGHIPLHIDLPPLKWGTVLCSESQRDGRPPDLRWGGTDAGLHLHFRWWGGLFVATCKNQRTTAEAGWQQQRDARTGTSQSRTAGTPTTPAVQHKTVKPTHLAPSPSMAQATPVSRRLEQVQP